MSAQGQQLQSRFVESYADRLHEEIADDLVLPEAASVARPGIGSAADVRGSVSVSAGSGAVPNSAGRGRDEIAEEVRDAQQDGRDRVGSAKSALDRQTSDARGASPEAADGVKEW